MRKLEIWCKIYFGHSLVIVFPGRKLRLPMEHPLTQTGFLAYAVVPRPVQRLAGRLG